eukprot:2635012-Rhodomonas_salina.1
MQSYSHPANCSIIPHIPFVRKRGAQLLAPAEDVRLGLTLVTQLTLICQQAPNPLGLHSTGEGSSEQLKHPMSTSVGHASASTMKKGLTAPFA